MDALFILAKNEAYELNYTPRHCLNHQTACSTYFGEDRIRYNRRQRKSATNGSVTWQQR